MTDDPLCATYKQSKEIGAQVRGGEKSSLVIFYKEYEVLSKACEQNGPKADDPEDDGKRRVAKARRPN